MVIAALIVLGLILGSFVNAFVWRLHKQEVLRAKRRKPTKKQLSKYSISTGRSMCPHCEHELAAKDLVPVVSWLLLRGKCRYCGKPIPDSPLVELVTALLFGASYLYWPLRFDLLGIMLLTVWLFFVVAFVALAVYDLRWMQLPDRVVYPLIGVAVVQVLLVAAVHHSPSDLLGPLVGALIISGLFYILFQVSGGRWIGGGDVKLAVVLGLLAGSPLKSLLLLFLSSLIGTLVSVPIALISRRSLHGLRVPFGPFLLAASVITVLCGSRIVDWYTLTLL